MLVNDSITDDEVGKSIDSRGMALSGIMIALLMATAKDVFRTTTMVFNEAKLLVDERSRLYSRRFGYCDTATLPHLNNADEGHGVKHRLSTLHEDSIIQDSAKFRTKTYKRNDPKNRVIRPPWHRTYCDGYGGGGSLGGPSYDGAVGGYLFVCSSTGDEHHKLYASHEQFPSALFQFLVHVESEGHRCNEIYMDTFTNNISAEAEEVAALSEL